jgi:hypothetical protein
LPRPLTPRLPTSLKLRLSLGQALAKLNSYNRSTTAGKRSAINLCVYTRKRRITVNESQLSRPAEYMVPRRDRGALRDTARAIFHVSSLS